jgi:hypothetical protein
VDSARLLEKLLGPAGSAFGDAAKDERKAPMPGQLSF